MNKERRKALDGAIEELKKAKDLVEALDFSEIKDLLLSAKSAVEETQEEEQDAFDNLSEGVQGGERGQRMEEIIDSLDGVATIIDELIGSIEDTDFISSFEEIIGSIESSKE